MFYRSTIIFLFFCLQSFGQNFGFHAGINYANILDKDGDRNVTDFLNFSRIVGLNLGVDYQQSISSDLFFVTGLAFGQKGYTSERLQQGPLGSAARDVKLNYIELPMKIKYQGANNIGPFISLGTYLAALVGGKYEFENSGFETTLKSEIKNFDFGLSFAGGFMVNKIGIELGYDLGLSNISNNPSIDSDRRTRSFFFKMTYWK